MNNNELRLQSLLLPDKGVCDVAELYYHEYGNAVDFDGYFNLFAIDKWRKYTAIDNLHLSLKCRGFSELRLMNRREEIGSVELCPSELREYDIEFPYMDESFSRDFWFRLVKSEVTIGDKPRNEKLSEDSREEKICKDTSKDNLKETQQLKDENTNSEASEKVNPEVSGYYYTKTEGLELRTVNIAADICTFKREDYILRNITQLKERIFDREELEAAEHFKVYVVDNGQSLDKDEAVMRLKEECRGRFIIIPNKNVGGAGGFTRGMIEAIKTREQEGWTHVVLMDDDAVNEPDSIVRTYALLRTLREEWKDCAIGGAIMREDFPYILHESGGVLKNCIGIPYREHNDLRDYDNCTVDYLMKPQNEFNMFSGWWYYCVPLSTIGEDNLPLPVFVHYDDIEYGVRNKDRGLIYLNGIGIWHRPFGITISPINIYTDVRNRLVTLAIHQPEAFATVPGVVKEVFIPLAAYLVRYRYKDVRMLKRAVEDFLKGPEFLMDTDPIEILKSVSGMGIKSEPLETAKDISEEERQKVRHFIDELPPENILQMGLAKREKKLKLINLLPLKKYKLNIISLAESPYRYLEYFGFKKQIIVEPYTDKIIAVKLSFPELFKCGFTCVGMSIKVLRNSRKIAKRYQQAFPEMTSLGFWERYLGMDKEDKGQAVTEQK